MKKLILATLIAATTAAQATNPRSDSALTGILVTGNQIILNCNASTRSAKAIKNQVHDCVCLTGFTQVKVSRHGRNNRHYKFSAKSPTDRDVSGYVVIVAY